MGFDVAQILHQPALRHPHRIALVESGAEPGRRSEISYGALDGGARAAAAALRAAGARPGARIALMAANGRPFLESWFGIAYAGCTIVPIPVVSTAPEVALRLRQAGCAAIVADATCRQVAARARQEAGGGATLLAAEQLPAGSEALTRPDGPAPDGIAMILQTSGTTGGPRGAGITHASLLAHTAVLVHHTLRLDAGDRVLGVLPLTHSYGIRMVVLTTFFAGARAVLSPRFEAGRSLTILASEEISWLPVVPTMLSAMAALPLEAGPSAPFPALRWALSAGSPLAEDVRRRAEERLGVEVRQGYGLTEATFSTIDAPPEPRTPGSVGRPVWGIEVRVVDDAGIDVPEGSQGQVLVRGHNVMDGYVDDVSGTAEVLRNGWMVTGDVGALDAKGRLTVVDRLKDVILRGGHSVYPSEVEDVLCRHPDVAEVAVVGRPHPHYGEEIVAVVVARPGACPEPAALDTFARESLARTKIPREVVFVDALPLGPSRKVLKRELRAQLADGRLRAVPVRGG